MAFDCDAAGLAQLAADIQQSGGSAQAVGGDLREPESLAPIIDAVVARAGRIDVLVNSAGISELVPWAELTVADWDRVLDVNLRGLFFLTQAVARHMQLARRGRIINIASVGGKRGGELTMHYGASKAGVINLTRSLSRALAAHNVTVNAVCPGYVETALTAANARRSEALGWKPGEREEQLIRSIPLGRLPELGEVGAAVMFLASDQAAYITGQSLNVDGGVVND
jgi:NAD(P)-dependent dehydrogenase (short-subunit alcohol dehydrogenase family)